MLDDVVRYVLDEVAMDGSIGTSPSRFIALFSRPSCPLNLANDDPDHSPAAAPDPSDPNAGPEPVTQEQEQEREHYAAYVWRMMVDLESISVVLLGHSAKSGPAMEGKDVQPDLLTADGPSRSADLEAVDTSVDFILDPALASEAHASLPQADALASVSADVDMEKDLETEKYDLMLLRDKYGDKVVMRASEAEIMNVLTGSYVRPSRLSNIVYTALQFIARGKEFGMSVLDIAKKTGQKPSTVFYLVKTLTDMGVAAKIKDTESNKTNIAVHRRYLNDNFQYQLRMEHLHYLADAAKDVKPDITEYEADDSFPINPSTGLPQFPPFGMESLGSRTFIKYRLVKLLRSDLWHHLIENRLLLKFMGFTPAYTTQIRRQFGRHLSAFKREGLIDEVMVPDESVPDKPHRCLRLAEFRPKDNEKETFEGALPNMLSNVIDPTLIDLEELEDDDLLEDDDAFDEPVAPKELGYDYAYTIDHAILQVVKGSGTQGVTIRQICRQLNHLDHKTVDVVVARYERLEHHPTHLNDFLFKVTQEVHMREKRLRVFTLENFRQRCLEDGIQVHGEIPTHPNIGRYADLSECKFARTQAEAKAALDLEWINVPRACGEINQEHKRFTRRLPGQARVPKTKKTQTDAYVTQDPQVLGRPRKFIRTVGLDGKLVRRTKLNLIPVHPELPSAYLYNSKTKVFFDVPPDWDGSGPVKAPPDWDTATEPMCPIIPSTGLPARKELEKEIKRKQKAAAAKEKPKKNKKHDRDDDDDEALPPKKKGRAKKAVDEAAVPKRKGRAGKGDKADPPPDESVEPVADQDDADAAPETVSAAPKGRPRRGAKAQANTEAASTRPPTRRRGPGKKTALSAEVVHDVDTIPDTDIAPAAGEPVEASNVSGVPVDAVPQPGPSFPSSPGFPIASDAMDIDPMVATSLPSHPPTDPPVIDDALPSGATPPPELAATDFELDPQLAGDEPSTSEQPTTSEQAAQSQGPVFSASKAPRVSMAARKRRRRISPVLPDEPAMDLELEPEPKKSKNTKLHKPRGSLQHPYRKREILEYLHSVGGVTVGGNFLCTNVWEWAQANGDGRTTFTNIPDKTTMERLLNSLEHDKEINQVSVAMNVQWGGSDRIPIVMLPNTPQGVVANFISESKRSRQRATVLPPRTLEPGFTRTASRVHVPNRTPVRLTEHALEPLLTPVSTLESLPAEQVREMFHRDWRLLAQSHGYIAGTFRRAKLLHLEILKTLQKQGEVLPTGDRVLLIDHLRREPSLESICKILPITVDDNELLQMLGDPAQASKPLHECKMPIQAEIGVRRKTMRFKLARLIVTLSELGILESGNVLVDDNRKPVSFEPGSAFTADYVKVKDKVPIYNYSADAPPEPTLPVKMTSIANDHDLEEYWYAVWFISLTKSDVNTAAVTRFTDESTVVGVEPAVIPTTLRRRMSLRIHWQSDYALQKAQRRYLDYVYQTEPGSAVADPARHEALAYRIFAPVPVVREYLRHLATRLAEQSADVRLHPVGTRLPTQQVRDAIAEKVRLRNERLEAEWSQHVTQLLQKVNQEATKEFIAFLEPLHKQYLRNPNKYGPQQIMNAVTSYFARLNSSGNVRAKQGRFTPHRPIADHVPRRARTKWTAQMEERARDAFVILEARKERLGVQNTGHNEALGQLFNQVDALKVRQRVLKWRRDHPSNEAYLQRMQAAWKQVYKEHVDEIPDPHPDSFQDFQLDAHVDIFRKYVKRDQRVSSFFVNSERKDCMPSLPEDVEQLSAAYDVQLRHKPMQVLEDVWSQYGDEKRDRALMAVSTVKPAIAEEPSTETETALKEAGLIDSVIKLIVANPLETFDEVKADRLLTPLNRSAVEYHVKDLLQRNVLTSYDKNNPNRAPGRAYLFQDSYYRALNNPISQDLQLDAEELLQTVPDEFVPWPMIAKEGEFASLLALVSEDMVDMHIDAEAALDILDTKGFRRARIVDDDCIELGVNLKLNEKGTQIAEGAQAANIPVWPLHTVIASGITETGEQRRTGKKREKVLLASALISAVENAGKDGVSISGLKEYFNEPESVIITAVEKALDHGKLVLTGYSKPVLVHPAFKAEWELSEECPRPKQWLDIHGGVVDIALYRCRRAVYGLLVQKPGINQHDLREHFSSLFNRQELNDLLQQLIQDGRVTRIVPSGLAVSEKYFDLLDVKYEPLISYMPEVLW